MSRPSLTLGTRIRELRLRAKISQRELADCVSKRLKDRRGFDFTYLSKVENSRLPYPPSTPVIIAIAAELAGRLDADKDELSDELLALAGKVSPDVGDMLKQSEGARVFFRSALSTRLSEEQWKAVLRKIKGEEET